MILKKIRILPTLVCTIFTLGIFQQVYASENTQNISTLTENVSTLSIANNIEQQEQKIEQYTQTVLDFLENVKNVINKIPSIISSSANPVNNLKFLAIIYKHFGNKIDLNIINAFFSLKKNNGFDRIANAVILLFVEIISNASESKLNNFRTDKAFDTKINNCWNKINQKINSIKTSLINTLNSYNLNTKNTNKASQNIIKTFIQNIINQFKMTSQYITSKIENTLQTTLNADDITNFIKLFSVATSASSTTFIQIINDIKNATGATDKSFTVFSNVMQVL